MANKDNKKKYHKRRFKTYKARHWAITLGSLAAIGGGISTPIILKHVEEERGGMTEAELRAEFAKLNVKLDRKVGKEVVKQLISQIQQYLDDPSNHANIQIVKAMLEALKNQL